MEAAAGVQWDRIISAAAASTLGIVSLSLLVLAVLAVLLFRGSGERARLIVFGAMLGLAVLCMGVAILRERSDPAAVGNQQVIPAEPVLEAPAASNSPAPVASASPAPIVTSASAGVAGKDLTGSWRDTDGFTYQITVEGTRFAYTQLLDGTPVGTGEGTVSGRQLRYRYIDARTEDSGTCSGLVSMDGGTIDGNCSNGEDQWGFQIVRAG